MLDLFWIVWPESYQSDRPEESVEDTFKCLSADRMRTFVSSGCCLLGTHPLSPTFSKWDLVFSFEMLPDLIQKKAPTLAGSQFIAAH